MGIESQYLGEINIPEEHRAEYAHQALKLLRACGSFYSFSASTSPKVGLNPPFSPVSGAWSAIGYM